MATPWFQQVENSRTAKNALIEQNHLAQRDADSRQEASYASQNRKETLGFANREAIERNGTAMYTAIERNNAEGRVTTLNTFSSDEQQLSHNFAHVLVGAKESRMDQAREVSDQKITGLKTQIEFEVDVINSEAGKGSEAVRKLALQQAQFAADVNAEMSSENGTLQEAREKGVRRLEVGRLNSNFEFEKDNTFLALQTERTHGDTNRRLALDRAANDSRVEAVTAAATLQEAEAKTKVLLYEIQNSAAIARNAFETKQLLKTTTAQTEQAAAASGVASTRDALIAARTEAAMLRNRRRE